MSPQQVNPLPDALTEEKVADFRSKICDIAIRQLTDNGIDRLSMRSIAREMGYSATALYSYYRNKEEILSAVKEDLFNRLSDSLHEIGERPLDPWLKLRMGLETYATFASAEPAAYVLALAPIRDTASYEGLQMAELRFREAFESLIKPLISAGQMSGEPSILAGLFWAMAHGLTTLSMAGKLPDRNSTDFNLLWLEAVTLLGRGANPNTSRKMQSKATESQFSLDL